MTVTEIREKFSGVDSVLRISDFMDQVSQNRYTNDNSRVYAYNELNGWIFQTTCNNFELNRLKQYGYSCILIYNR